MDGFSPDDLKSLGDGPVNAMALNKLAIDHADGVIQASENIPAELVEYAKSLGKPFLPYQGEEIDGVPVVEFYDSIRNNP